ncbi:MAG: hypothetical protein ACXWXG_10510 [Actinomycetota bacterium]
MRRGRLASALAVVAISASACTGDGIGIEFGSPASPSASTAQPESPSDASGRGITLDVDPVDTGEARALAAMRALCEGPVPTSTDDDGAPRETPADVADLESQVEQVRELEFLREVVVQPVSAEEIAGKLEGAFDETYPKEFYDRRSVAWQTLGVIPRDVDIREALLAFQTGQVVGFYNPVDGELVFRADGDLDVVERVTLAHELTHAIDDQHFDLSRIDGVAARCRDEAFQAALGAVEGSAQFFSIRLLFEFPPADGDFSGLGDGGSMPDGVPPFMVDLQLWPYTAGQAFVTELEARGGVGEVDEALRTFPTTTEQILHPERYPDDVASRVDVPDLSDALGDGWGDLDVMQVGEAWLTAMLGLRLDAATAEAAAAGWDGGLYRAFTDGDDAAVVLTTAWDSVADADAFEQAAREWFEADDASGIVGRPERQRVTLAVATVGGAVTDVLTRVANS